MNPRRSVVIVGGGFAGTTVARALDGRLPPDADPDAGLRRERIRNIALRRLARIELDTDPSLAVADAYLQAKAAHLCRVDLGPVLPNRRQSLALYRQP